MRSRREKPACFRKSKQLIIEFFSLILKMFIVKKVKIINPWFNFRVILTILSNILKWKKWKFVQVFTVKMMLNRKINLPRKNNFCVSNATWPTKHINSLKWCTIHLYLTIEDFGKFGWQTYVFWSFLTFGTHVIKKFFAADYKVVDE